MNVFVNKIGLVNFVAKVYWILQLFLKFELAEFELYTVKARRLLKKEYKLFRI